MVGMYWSIAAFQLTEVPSGAVIFTTKWLWISLSSVRPRLSHSLAAAVNGNSLACCATVIWNGTPAPFLVRLTPDSVLEAVRRTEPAAPSFGLTTIAYRPVAGKTGR